MVTRCERCKQAVQLFDDGRCFRCTNQFHAPHPSAETTHGAVHQLQTQAPAIAAERESDWFGGIAKWLGWLKGSAGFEAFRNLSVLALITAVTVGAFVFVVNRDADSPQPSAAMPTTVVTPGAATVQQSPLAATTARASEGGFSRLDSAFIQSLDDAGVTYRAPSDAVFAAKAACDNLAIGSNPVADLRALVEIFQMTAGHSRADAENYVGFSVAAYCPKYESYLTF